MDVEVFTAAAGAAERWIASDEVAARWAQSSTLEGYTVAGLAGHLARAVLTVERCLAAPAATTGGGGTDAAGYFAVVLGTDDPVDSERHRRIRDRGAETAADGPRALAVQVGEARQRLEGRLGAATLAQPIEVAGGVTLAVADYLETRVVELVVHLDDLAVSVGSDEPAAAGRGGRRGRGGAGTARRPPGHQQNWVSYRSTCEWLEHEKYLYLAGAGPYADATNPARLLATRVEGLISQEHASWVEPREEAAEAVSELGSP